MPKLSLNVIAGGVLALSLLTLAVGFARSQLAARRRRDLGPDAEDRAYFRRQDRRRLAGSALMGLIAVGMAVGLSVDPLAGRRHGTVFVSIWAGVLVLVMALLVLAMIDWAAIRGYSRRHREALIAEGRAAAAAHRAYLEQIAKSEDPDFGSSNGHPHRGPHVL